MISNDGYSITALAKYNLLVGNSYDYSTKTLTALENPTGIQSADAIGADGNSMLWYGEIAFSPNGGYWTDVTSYPTYVYNENSNIYSYVESYKDYLESLGVSIVDARVITYEEVVTLGCSVTDLDCASAPEWVYSSTYWTGSASGANNLWYINSMNLFNGSSSKTAYCAGIRPVIKISLSEF